MYCWQKACTKQRLSFWLYEKYVYYCKATTQVQLQLKILKTCLVFDSLHCTFFQRLLELWEVFNGRSVSFANRLQLDCGSFIRQYAGNVVYSCSALIVRSGNRLILSACLVINLTCSDWKTMPWVLILYCFIHTKIFFQTFILLSKSFHCIRYVLQRKASHSAEVFVLAISIFDWHCLATTYM